MDLKVRAKIGSLNMKSRKLWGLEIHISEIFYWSNYGTTLGVWHKKSKNMWLHRGVLEEYGQVFIDDVVAHEFAHAVVSNMYPDGCDENGKKIRSHGKEFKKVCRAFGICEMAKTPLFRESVWVRGYRSGKMRYKCGCKIHLLSKVMHNRLVKRRWDGVCSECGRGVRPSLK